MLPSRDATVVRGPVSVHGPRLREAVANRAIFELVAGEGCDLYGTERCWLVAIARCLEMTLDVFRAVLDLGIQDIGAPALETQWPGSYTAV